MRDLGFDSFSRRKNNTFITFLVVNVLFTNRLLIDKIVFKSHKDIVIKAHILTIHKDYCINKDFNTGSSDFKRLKFDSVDSNLSIHMNRWSIEILSSKHSTGHTAVESKVYIIIIYTTLTGEL